MMKWEVYWDNQAWDEETQSMKGELIGGYPESDRPIVTLLPNGSVIHQDYCKPKNIGYPKQFLWMYQEDWQYSVNLLFASTFPQTPVK